MVLMILENVSPSLRGELSKWMMEIKAGVFLGRISALVRDSLWEKCEKKLGEGGMLMAYPWPCEQGFVVMKQGRLSRDPIDNDGITLIRQNHREIEF